VLFVVTVALAVAVVAVSVGWILSRRATWAVRRTRYGHVDQRWLVPIAVCVDAVYAGVGVQSGWGSGSWVNLLTLVAVQTALIAGWLVYLFRRSPKAAGGRLG
jgi:hypothetical protein